MQPYNVITIKNNSYEFVTAAGIKYACYFLSYAEYFKDYKEIAENIYAFNIDIIEKGRAKFTDERIGFTLVKVIKTFLDGLNNAVVYVCDTSDNKELLRKRKFDSWFRKYDDGTIIKVDGHIEFENFEIYNAILIHKDNLKKNKFIEAFNDLNNTSNK